MKGIEARVTIQEHARAIAICVEVIKSLFYGNAQEPALRAICAYFGYGIEKLS